MRVGVVGATGAVGREVLRALHGRGLAAVPLVRRPERCAGARRLDLTAPSTMPAALEGLDAVISVAGAPLAPWPVRGGGTFEAVDRDGHAALGKACADAGVRRVVYGSVHGEGLGDLAYVAAHHDAEAALRASVDTVALRPVGLFGAFDQLLPAAALGLGVDLRGGTARTNPLAEADLAVAMVEALLVPDAAPVQSLGGPEVFTRAELWALAFRARGRRGVHLPGSPALLRLGAAGLRRLDRRAADVLDFVARILVTDCVAPARGTRTLAAHWGVEAVRARA